MSDDPTQTVKEVAEATKAVANATNSGIQLTEKAFTWLAQMLGEDAAGLLKDRIFYWRAKNALSLQEKLDKELEKRGLTNPRILSLRLAIPFFEAATLEDDPMLQQRWAHLLANAMDPSYKVPIERCYGKVLEELSPQDCLIFETIEKSKEDLKGEFTCTYLSKKLSIESQTISISLGNLRRLELLENKSSRPFGLYRHGITDFGESFLAACTTEDIYIEMQGG